MKTLLKKITPLYAIYRMFNATKYFNNKYSSIVSFGFNSKEDGNYTYPLTESNEWYLAQTISVVANVTH